ncbi:MAG: hypothetical protein ACXU8U_11730, partial [Asticcacaulis sp.]
WQSPEESRNHPFPGTHPIIVTDVNDWGGWRVPGAEYDRDPVLIELQARLIAAAPQLLHLAKSLREYVRRNAEDLDDDLVALARQAEALRKQVETSPMAADAPARARAGAKG